MSQSTDLAELALYIPLSAGDTFLGWDSTVVTWDRARLVGGYFVAILVGGHVITMVECC